MASGTFTGSHAGNSYGPWLTLNWNEIEQDIPNNRTKVRLILRFHWDRNISYRFNSRPGTLHGSGYTYSGNASGGSGSLVLRQQDVWISHGSDGTKSQSFSGNIRSLGLSWSGIAVNTMSVSGTAKLTTIPRKSDLTSVSIYALTANTVNTLKVTSNVKYTGFYHQITIHDGSTYVWGSGFFKGSPAANYSIPADTVNYLLNLTKTTTSKTLTVKLGTYTKNSDSGHIGTSTRNMAMSIHASVAPSISSRTISEAVAGLNVQFGAYVQGKSKLKLEMNASAGHGASIRSYRIIVNGTTYTTRTATTGELKNSGSQTVTFEVTDSRGRKATVTNTINVIAYSPPRINSLTAERANSSGAIDDEGTHALVKYNVSISPIGNKNTKSFILRYRQNGTDPWQSITLANANYSYNTSRVIGPLNVDYAFDVQIVVKDYFDEILLTEIVPSTFTLINFAASKRGMSLGRAYDEVMGGILQIEGFQYGTEVKENANGMYIKSLDGQLICLKHVTHAVTINTSLGGNTYASSEQPEWEFPHVFKNKPFINCSSLNYFATGAINHYANTTMVRYRPFHPVSTTSADKKEFMLMAIGRWK